ncbi:MAG TPA: hypothetical protein VL281_09625 [Mycobacteriales bacterium]|nr:hypothetical protein [Mycobacteriales bacterium]
MADIPVNADIAAAGNTTRTATLQMNDTGVSQDPCQDAALTLHFSSN